MRHRNMLKTCLVFEKSEPHYAYKLYAYKQKTCNEMFELPWGDFVAALRKVNFFAISGCYQTISCTINDKF